MDRTDPFTPPSASFLHSERLPFLLRRPSVQDQI